MPLTVILAAAAVTAAIPLLWWSVASSRLATRTVDRSVLAGRSGGGATDLRVALLDRSANERAVMPAVFALAQLGRRLTPLGWIDALDRRLTMAGRPATWPLERILAGKILLGVGAFLVGFLLFADARSMTMLLVWAGMTALGYFTPDLLLHSQGQKRQLAIRQELPDTMDQMTISVEAGLGFEAAMARAGKTGDGPLADELIRTMQEVQVGVPRIKALRNLADRTDVPDLRHFVMAVVQAEGYGIAIADVLRTQAAELRVKRRQRAEERAMKIPVKVVFPLVLCILPTLFIIILGPAAIQISRSMFGGGGAL